MDKLLGFFVAIALPTGALYAARMLSGHTGGAAMTSALDLLGGPLGMSGGLMTLGLLVLVGKAAAETMFQRRLERKLRRALDKGVTPARLVETVRTFPVSRGLKLQLIESVARPQAAGEVG